VTEAAAACNRVLLSRVEDLANAAGVSRRTIYKWRQRFADAPARVLSDDGDRCEDPRAWLVWAAAAGMTKAYANLKQWLASREESAAVIGTDPAVDGLAAEGETAEVARLVMRALEEGPDEAGVARLLEHGVTIDRIAKLNAEHLQSKARRIALAQAEHDLIARRMVEDVIDTLVGEWVGELKRLWSGILPGLDSASEPTRKAVRASFDQAVEAMRERVAESVRSIANNLHSGSTK
jgi:hypothetical protein